MMAISGTPDGKEKYDADMAAAYLRLVREPAKPGANEPDYLPQAPAGLERKLEKKLLKAGFTPEKDPQGNLALGYGCVSVQRRNNWAAVYVVIHVTYGMQSITWMPIFMDDTWVMAACRC